MVVVDHLIKLAHFGALPNQVTAAKATELFVDMVGNYMASLVPSFRTVIRYS